MNKKKSTKIKIAVAVIVCTVIALVLIFNSAFGSMFSFIGNQYRNWEIGRLATTDLSNITVDTIRIGSNLEDVDLAAYQASNRFRNSGGDHAYYFDELILDVDDNKVSYIFAFDEDVLLNINGNKDISTIEEISGLLGENYLAKTEDREQRLIKHIYYDKEIRVVAEIVYSDYDGEFVWIALWR
ncbi:hypothetical protein [Sporomusa termitida]|uniref:Uncharacterized protein n=1 Tax=Sporomusa termitida TaxID=2377 RepID=A0A517DYE4_9FIRM|nr:hypothetical protein [Sporomusa termitida]QDR82371.1 hypothetical protein SPTER_37960 [Sporomusa termitida]